MKFKKFTQVEFNNKETVSIIEAVRTFIEVRDTCDDEVIKEKTRDIVDVITDFIYEYCDYSFDEQAQNL